MPMQDVAHMSGELGAAARRGQGEIVRKPSLMIPVRIARLEVRGWSGAGSNRRPLVFQTGTRRRSTLL